MCYVYFALLGLGRYWQEVASPEWDLRSAEFCADRASIAQQVTSWASNSWVGSAVACKLGSCFEEDLKKETVEISKSLAFLLQIKTKVPLNL